MTTLTLDLGNTALKYGVFTPAGLQESGVLAVPSQLRDLWQRYQPAHAILASVATEAEAQPWLHELKAGGRSGRGLPAAGPAHAGRGCGHGPETRFCGRRWHLPRW
ncbi:MAG: hypothetical protein EOO36_24925 [Cytophagaceae bacterium]|nr:MAG: hypothetical protein EOO36_24925 [Cytophagaceae bacterium]